MPCYHPVMAGRSLAGRNPRTGLWPVVFNVANGVPGKELIIPCGKCLGCIEARARNWAIRCVHESKCWENNCFITLTYNDENIHKNYSLDKRDFVLFMKKLRRKYGNGIRFFHCGEYGENFHRPHHHACLFNHKFGDAVLWSVRGNVNIFTSKELSELWGYGYVTVGEVTYESAAYVARYVAKKMYGASGDIHYGDRTPEYCSMSLRPGIGMYWFMRYGKSDVYVDDTVLFKGKKFRPPRYYDSIYDRIEPDRMLICKSDRIINLNPAEHTYRRLLDKEEIKTIAYKKLIRNYETGSGVIK
ncbi:MAG: replication initiator protein [Microvirus sp.]|nr:MAG: replication initiator protein [Microvirus sp.]